MIITVSREHGAAGLGVAKVAAELLGYRLIDKELPRIAASRLGTSEEAVEASEMAQPLGQRILLGLSLANLELRAAAPLETDIFTDDCRREIEVAVHELAAEGNVVIVGRFANMILGPRDDTLRVFAHAPRAWRVARIAELYHADVKRAATEVDRLDRARHHWAQEYYHTTREDMSNFELAVDVSRLGIEGSGKLIAAAAHEMPAR